MSIKSGLEREERGVFRAEVVGGVPRRPGKRSVTAQILKQPYSTPQR